MFLLCIENGYTLNGCIGCEIKEIHQQKFISRSSILHNNSYQLWFFELLVAFILLLRFYNDERAAHQLSG